MLGEHVGREEVAHVGELGGDAQLDDDAADKEDDETYGGRDAHKVVRERLVRRGLYLVSK